MLRNTSPNKFVQTIIETAPQGPVCIISQNGGGQTVITKNLLSAVIQDMKNDPTVRMILVDQDLEWFSSFQLPDREMLLLDSKDPRSVYWDIKQDIGPGNYDLAQGLSYAACQKDRIRFSFRDWFSQASVDKLPGDPWSIDLGLMGRRVLIVNTYKEDSSCKTLSEVLKALLSTLRTSNFNFPENGPKTFLVIPDIAHKSSILETFLTIVEQGRSHGIQSIFSFGDFQWATQNKTLEEHHFNHFLSNVSAFVLGKTKGDFSFLTEENFNMRFGEFVKLMSANKTGVSKMVGPIVDGLQSIGILAQDQNVRKLLWPYLKWDKVR